MNTNTHKHSAKCLGEFHSVQNMVCRGCQQWHIKANKCVYLQAMSRITVLIELGPQCSRQTISVFFLDPISPPSLPEGLSLTFLTLLNPTGLLCLHGDTMINPCPSILRTARHNVGVNMHVLPD